MYILYGGPFTRALIVEMVRERPKLRAKFDELAESVDRYAQMEAHGEGVK